MSRGRFTGVTGKLTYHSADIAESHVEATIDASTIDTRDPQRDTHLKSPDFLDVEKFPSLTFSSSRVTRRANGDILVAGPLSIHGVTREVEFAVEGPTPPVKDPWGNTRVGVTASTTIDRREFGLTFNATLETGGVLVGEEVRHHPGTRVRSSRLTRLSQLTSHLAGIVNNDAQGSNGAPTIPDSTTIRLQLQIRGIVQGVGFRPYVHNLARRHALVGFVLNSPRGVFIEVEGNPATVEAFVAALPAEAPPLVRIAQTWAIVLSSP